jgi:hypothetical protein
LQNSPSFGGYFFHCLGLRIYYSKNWTGLRFGLFFANLSGRPGVDVMITIFCDFRQFSAKKWRFSQKSILCPKFLINLTLLRDKNANIFAKIFFAKIFFKILTSALGIGAYQALSKSPVLFALKRYQIVRL